MDQPTTRFTNDRKPFAVWKPAVAFVAALAGTLVGAAEHSKSAAATAGAQTDALKLAIKVGTKTFTATLEDNNSAKAFKARLPVTVRMTELNGNEKYFRFSADLPTNASIPGTIQTGDLMIYGRNTLVLFYKTFPTSYSYTRVGRINDPAGLAAAVGSGDVTVTYEAPDKAEGKSR